MMAQHKQNELSEQESAPAQFEPFWTCRLCTSAGLLATSHAHCPNCGHERDTEVIVFPDWDDLVSNADHRFTGTAWSCCDRGWSNEATFCGCCARQGIAHPQPSEQSKRPVQLQVFSSFGFHLNVAGIDIGAFDDDEPESNLVFLGSPLEGVRTLRVQKD